MISDGASNLSGTNDAPQPTPTMDLNLPDTIPGVLQRMALEFQCAICLNTLSNPVVTPCNHTFCKDCLNHHLQGATRHNNSNNHILKNSHNHRQSICPLCNTVITKRSLKQGPEHLTILVDLFEELKEEFQKTDQDGRTISQIVRTGAGVRSSFGTGGGWRLEPGLDLSLQYPYPVKENTAAAGESSGTAGPSESMTTGPTSSTTTGSKTRMTTTSTHSRNGGSTRSKSRPTSLLSRIPSTLDLYSSEDDAGGMGSSSELSDPPTTSSPLREREASRGLVDDDAVVDVDQDTHPDSGIMMATTAETRSTKTTTSTDMMEGLDLSILDLCIDDASSPAEMLQRIQEIQRLMRQVSVLDQVYEQEREHELKQRQEEELLQQRPPQRQSQQQQSQRNHNGSNERSVDRPSRARRPTASPPPPPSPPAIHSSLWSLPSSPSNLEQDHLAELEIAFSHPLAGLSPTAHEQQAYLEQSHSQLHQNHQHHQLQPESQSQISVYQSQHHNQRKSQRQSQLQKTMTQLSQARSETTVELVSQRHNSGLASYCSQPAFDLRDQPEPWYHPSQSESSQQRPLRVKREPSEDIVRLQSASQRCRVSSSSQLVDVKHEEPLHHDADDENYVGDQENDDNEVDEDRSQEPNIVLCLTGFAQKEPKKIDFIRKTAKALKAKIFGEDFGMGSSGSIGTGTATGSGGSGGGTGLASTSSSTGLTASSGTAILGGLDKITHTVVGTDTGGHAGHGRTEKYFMAILQANWLVTFEWIKASMEAGYWVREDDYQIGENEFGINGAKRSRYARFVEGKDPLLWGIDVQLTGKFVVHPKEWLEKLCKIGGARVVGNLRDDCATSAGWSQVIVSKNGARKTTTVVYKKLRGRAGSMTRVKSEGEEDGGKIGRVTRGRGATPLLSQQEVVKSRSVSRGKSQKQQQQETHFVPVERHEDHNTEGEQDQIHFLIYDDAIGGIKNVKNGNNKKPTRSTSSSRIQENHQRLQEQEFANIQEEARKRNLIHKKIFLVRSRELLDCIANYDLSSILSSSRRGED